MAVTDWGGANSRFLGLVYVGTARSLDQTALRPSNDVKYIIHMQSVLAKKLEMYTQILKGETL